MGIMGKTYIGKADAGIDMNWQAYMDEMGELHRQEENAKADIAKPFPDEAVLEEKSRRLAELNAKLDVDRQENVILEGLE